MKLKAIGLSVAGLMVTGGLIAGATGATAAPGQHDPRAHDDVLMQPTQPPVTQAERAAITAAIQQRDGSVTVHAVRRAPDGSFRALGSKAGQPVLAEVSTSHERVTLQERLRA